MNLWSTSAASSCAIWWIVCSSPVRNSGIVVTTTAPALSTPNQAADSHWLLGPRRSTRFPGTMPRSSVRTRATRFAAATSSAYDHVGWLGWCRHGRSAPMRAATSSSRAVAQFRRSGYWSSGRSKVSSGHCSAGGRRSRQNVSTWADGSSSMVDNVCLVRDDEQEDTIWKPSASWRLRGRRRGASRLARAADGGQDGRVTPGIDAHVDEGRTGARHGRPEGRVELLDGRGAVAVQAVAAGDGGEVDVSVASRVLSPVSIRFGLDRDQAQPRVVEHHDRDGEAESTDGLELTEAHPEPAVTGETHDAAARTCQGRTDGCGYGVPHRREPAGDQHFVEILHRPQGHGG